MAAVGVRVRPTKGFLLELKETLSMIREGYKLLSIKRDELTSKLKALLDELAEVRRKVMVEVEDALSSFREVYAILGPDAVEAYASMNRGLLKVKVVPVSIMGVHTPTIKEVEFPGVKDKFGPIVRGVATRLGGIVKDFLKVVELESRAEAIALDLERTNRIVNALEKIIIPEMEATIKYVEDVLEEESLEEFVRLKKIREILERRRGMG